MRWRDVTTVAGNGAEGYGGDGGHASQASLRWPTGVAVDHLGNVFIADQVNHRVRKVTPSGMISTAAGNGVPGYSGDGGPALGASLRFPSAVAVDPTGNLYIVDEQNKVIRKVATDGIITTVAGNGESWISGDGGPATDVSLESPSIIAVDANGTVYVGGVMLRQFKPGGVITTVAGNGVPGFSGDGGPATQASLRAVLGIAIESSGTLYLADMGNNRVRKVSFSQLPR